MVLRDSASVRAGRGPGAPPVHPPCTLRADADAPIVPLTCMTADHARPSGGDVKGRASRRRQVPLRGPLVAAARLTRRRAGRSMMHPTPRRSTGCSERTGADGPSCVPDRQPRGHAGPLGRARPARGPKRRPGLLAGALRARGGPAPCPRGRGRRGRGALNGADLRRRDRCGPDPCPCAGRPAGGPDGRGGIASRRVPRASGERRLRPSRPRHGRFDAGGVRTPISRRRRCGRSSPPSRAGARCRYR